MSKNINSFNVAETTSDAVSNTNMQTSRIEDEWLNGWELFYWSFSGRGQYIRLMLELGKVQYEQPLKDLSYKKAFAQILQICGTGDERRAFAVPILINKRQNVFLSQTPAIVLFLADIFLHLKPKNLQDMSRARLMMFQVFDAVDEARNTLSSVNFSQKKEAYKIVATFLKTRLYKHLEVLTAELKRNKNENGWFYGKNITFVDVCCATFLRDIEFTLPEHFAKARDIQTLKDHRERFESQEFFQDFVNSDRCPRSNIYPGFGVSSPNSKKITSKL